MPPSSTTDHTHLAADPLEMGRRWADQRAEAGDHVGARTMRRAIATLEHWLPTSTPTTGRP